MSFLTLPPVPVVKFNGVWTVRAAISPQSSDETDSATRWRLAPGLRRREGEVDGNELGIVGDLTVTTGSAFGGVTVFGLLCWDDMPDFDTDDETHWAYADALVAQLSEWAAHVLYDAASAAFNSMASSTPYEMTAPWQTPEVEIQTSDEVRQTHAGFKGPGGLD